MVDPRVRHAQRAEDRDDAMQSQAFAADDKTVKLELDAPNAKQRIELPAGVDVQIKLN